MADTVFRKSEEEKVVEEKPIKVDPSPDPIQDDKLDVPYLDKPNFLDEYFGIGSEWHDRDANFYPEVRKIDTYIRSKIREGEIGNDQKVVKDLLKGMEKLNNLKGETRSVVKLEVLSNYVEFLMKNEHLKSNLKRY